MKKNCKGSGEKRDEKKMQNRNKHSRDSGALYIPHEFFKE